MPDITMCDGGGCPRKDTCYRHTAIPNEYRQSYFSVVPAQGGGGWYCEYYWNDKDYRACGRVVTKDGSNTG